MDKFEHIYGKSEKRTIDKDLLPCPFCGSKATLSGMFPQGQYYISCTGCRVSLWQDRTDKAISNWNTRTNAQDGIQH